MRTLRRGFRTILRSPLRTMLLVSILAVSIGLTLIMITVDNAFAKRLVERAYYARILPLHHLAFNPL